MSQKKTRKTRSASVVVSPETHDRLKARAKQTGMKLYALAERVIVRGLDELNYDEEVSQ